MTDLKISQFTDGGPAEETDEIAAVRAGVNTRIFVGSMAAEDASDYTPTADFGALAFEDVINAADIGAGTAAINISGNAATATTATSATTAGSATTATTATNATNSVVTDAASDTTMFLALVGSATGNLPIQTDAGLSYDASTNALTGTGPFTAPTFNASDKTTSITGTATNNNAAAGYVGEYIEASLAVGSAVALTSGATSNIISISLTAGDWDVSAVAFMTGNAATSYTVQAASITSVSATFPAAPSMGWSVIRTAAYVPGTGANTMPMGPLRFSLSSTTTIYLVVSNTFTVNTAAAYGVIRARRVR